MFDENMMGEVTDTENSAEAAIPQDSTATETTSVDTLEQFLAEPIAQDEAGDTEEQAQGTEQETQPETAIEHTEEAPKGIRGRIADAERKADARGYERGKQEAKKQWDSERTRYEERIRRYAEMELEHDAKELANKEHCSVDFAKRMLRLERNMPAPVQEQSAKDTPRDENVRFAPRQAATGNAKERANYLYAQAEDIRKTMGIDVLSIFRDNAEVRQKVASGEWSFIDVAMQSKQEQARTPKASQAPKPVTSGGTSNSQPLDFMNMSDEQWEEFNRRVAKGQSYRIR